MVKIHHNIAYSGKVELLSNLSYCICIDHRQNFIHILMKPEIAINEMSYDIEDDIDTPFHMSFLNRYTNLFICL